MAKKKRARKTKQSPKRSNFLLWGVIGGGFLLFVIGINVLTPGAESEPTPVLTERFTSVEAYCETYPERCLQSGEAATRAALVEISDYGCSHCYAFNRDSAPALWTSYVDSDRLEWVVLPYALDDVTAPSAAAVLCAREQDLAAAFDLHERLFELQTTRSAHTAAGFSTLAAAVPGLDLERFDRCVADGVYDDTVSLNRQLAAQLGINSTPTFFIGGTSLEGNRQLTDFINAIERLVSNS